MIARTEGACPHPTGGASKSTGPPARWPDRARPRRGGQGGRTGTKATLAVLRGTPAPAPGYTILAEGPAPRPHFLSTAEAEHAPRACSEPQPARANFPGRTCALFRAHTQGGAALSGGEEPAVEEEQHAARPAHERPGSTRRWATPTSSPQPVGPSHSTRYFVVIARDRHSSTRTPAAPCTAEHGDVRILVHQQRHD